MAWECGKQERRDKLGDACLIPESLLMDWVAVHEILWTRHVERVVEERLILFTRGWELNFGLLGPREIQDKDAANTSSRKNSSNR